MKPRKATDPRCQLHLSLSINLLSNSSHPNAVKFQSKSSNHLLYSLLDPHQALGNTGIGPVSANNQHMVTHHQKIMMCFGRKGPFPMHRVISFAEQLTSQHISTIFLPSNGPATRQQLDSLLHVWRLGWNAKQSNGLPFCLWVSKTKAFTMPEHERRAWQTEKRLWAS